MRFKRRSNNSSSFLSIAIPITVFLFYLSGCALHRPMTDPVLDQKALAAAQKIESHNRHITTSKGTGRIHIQTATENTTLSMAWAAEFPDKLRITFLMSATPLETIIVNKDKITLISHTGQYKTKSFYSEDPDLKKVIQVPVKLSEMIRILLGRFPIIPLEDAYFSPVDQTLSRIVLQQKSSRKRQVLTINKKGQCDAIRVENSQQKKIYEIKVMAYKTFGQEEMFHQFSAADHQGNQLDFEIFKFITNPPLKPSVF